MTVLLARRLRLNKVIQAATLWLSGTRQSAMTLGLSQRPFTVAGCSRVSVDGVVSRVWARAGSESGSALVEAAMVLPILLVVVLGIGRFGITFNNYIIVTDAVRAGGRQLALSRGLANPCLAAKNRVLSAATSLAPASLTITTVVNSTSYAGTCNAAVMTVGSDATVTATYPCDLAVFGINYAPGCTLTSTVTERVE